MPAHEYSYHVHPWEEILHYVSINQVSNLKRNIPGQEIYVKWTSETIEQYGSVTNYLKKEKVIFPPDTDVDEKGRPITLILPNDFPYSVDPGITHVLIWSKVPLLKQHVESLLDERYGSSIYEWSYFVNPPEVQSIPSMPHVHVFMRKRSPQE
ncbi:hypothetical protein K501DRAFT_333247 [Backusella circina FSU 941]|nr:hypothetical protein K501DRAFT_333247 [Backusella circina FSU 941]